MPDDTEANVVNPTDAKRDNTGAKADGQQTALPAKTAQRQRNRAFRRGLLTKLPKLAIPRWEVSDALNVFQDIQGIVELDSDAFLQPWENLSEERHG
jgi:hypothetical protein